MAFSVIDHGDEILALATFQISTRNRSQNS
jgi:hypothetical protein